VQRRDASHTTRPAAPEVHLQPGQLSLGTSDSLVRPPGCCQYGGTTSKTTGSALFTSTICPGLDDATPRALDRMRAIQQQRPAGRWWMYRLTPSEARETLPGRHAGSGLPILGQGRQPRCCSDQTTRGDQSANARCSASRKKSGPPLPYFPARRFRLLSAISAPSPRQPRRSLLVSQPAAFPMISTSFFSSYFLGCVTRPTAPANRL